MLQHLNRIQDRSLTLPLQNLHFVFLEPFRGGLAGVFGIDVLLLNLSALELEVTIWRLDILLQDFLIVQNSWFNQLWQVSPRHHTTSTLFDCWHNDLFLWNAVLVYARCNGINAFQKVQLLSHQSTEYLPKSLWDNLNFFGKCETSLCVLFGQQCLLLGNSHNESFTITCI